MMDALLKQSCVALAKPDELYGLTEEEIKTVEGC